MPKFTYAGDEGRVYPDLPPPANAPEPGQSYDLDRDPGDGRWGREGSKKTAADNEEK